MHESIKAQLNQEGYVVLEDFLSPEECDELVVAAQEFTQCLPSKEDRAIFSANAKDDKQVSKNTYFIESNDKIRPFFEETALDAEGNLTVDPTVALNKLGHALHLLHPIFRCYTYCDRVKSLCRALDMVEPSVVQSMFIFKNPGTGGEVMPHQDATYLFTEPSPPVGFWIALDDATVQNGCLWIARGSHKSGVHRRMVRTPDKTSIETTYDRPAATYPSSSFKPVPVKKGTCILIHGLVVHKSDHNKSDKSRPAYTFHVIEKYNNAYSPLNWIQEGEGAPFYNLYRTNQLF